VTLKKNLSEKVVPLYGPRNGKMDPFVAESLSASMHLKLWRDAARKEIIFEGNGMNVGLEVVNDVEHLIS